MGSGRSATRLTDHVEEVFGGFLALGAVFEGHEQLGEVHALGGLSDDALDAAARGEDVLEVRQVAEFRRSASRTRLLGVVEVETRGVFELDVEVAPVGIGDESEADVAPDSVDRTWRRSAGARRSRPSGCRSLNSSTLLNARMTRVEAGVPPGFHPGQQAAAVTRPWGFSSTRAEHRRQREGDEERDDGHDQHGDGERADELADLGVHHG